MARGAEGAVPPVLEKPVADLAAWQYAAIAVLFVWSGFVRAQQLTVAALGWSRSARSPAPAAAALVPAAAGRWDAFKGEDKGYALQYASKRLRDDRDIVMAAVTHVGSPLEYASERLQNDPDIIRVAHER